jgi:hypothetical protein
MQPMQRLSRVADADRRLDADGAFDQIAAIAGKLSAPESVSDRWQNALTRLAKCKVTEVGVPPDPPTVRGASGD